MMADGTIQAIAKQWVGRDYDMAGMIAKAKAQKE